MKKEKITKSEQAIADGKAVIIMQSATASSRDKEAAFNHLYSTHQSKIGFYFYLRVDKETAEDLKMTTFEKAYSGIKGYSDEYAFSTWLHKIAKNTYIDHLRKEHKDLFFSLNENDGDSDAVPFQVKCDSLSPEETFVKNERIHRVRDAIASLDNDLVRELMTERFVNDLSFDQIAEKLGIENNSTLRVNILRGKEIIKETLADLA